MNCLANPIFSDYCMNMYVACITISSTVCGLSFNMFSDVFSDAEIKILIK